MKLTHINSRIGHFTDIYFNLDEIEINPKNICHLTELLNPKNSPYNCGYFNISPSGFNSVFVHLRIETVLLPSYSVSEISSFIKECISKYYCLK